MNKQLMAGIVALLAWHATANEGAAMPPREVPAGDPAMEAAFRKAKATLDGFLFIASSPAAHLERLSVKIRIREGNASEYFWIAPFRPEENGFSGLLANPPSIVRKYRLGDLVRFTRDDIVDWTYFDRSRQRIFGNFTACAIMARDSPEEREKARKEHGLHCDS